MRISLLLLSFLLTSMAALAQPVSILTQRYGVDRLGWNQRETVLNAANVRPATFGLLYTYPVDDQVYAQPLLVMGVPMGTSTRNLLIVATVNNSVYAFDADTAMRVGGRPLWQRSLTRAGGFRAPLNTDMTGACGGNYKDFSGNMGIVGTPVVDTATQTLYVVHREVNTGGTRVHSQWLHALDLASGDDRPGSPVRIAASVTGTGSGSVAGVVSFDAQKNNQRPGLLLHRGVVYIGWASHCDWGPYHGWLLGYDAETLAQRVVYNVTPDGSNGGIWMSGCAPMVDADGDIYLTTGNGSVGFSSNRNNPRNRGESLLRLRNVNDSLHVIKFFTPANFQYLEDQDLDYGSDGAILIPGTRLVISGSKDGIVYMTHADSMAGYSAANTSVLQAFEANIQRTGAQHIHGTPVYSAYRDAAGHTVGAAYVWAEADSLKCLPFDSATKRFDLAHIRKGHVKLDNGMPGSMLCTSSNGLENGSTILWANHPLSGNANQQVRPGRLQAYDVRDISRPIWSTDGQPSDNFGNFSKFNTPVVANGKVYLATFSNRIAVYGLLTPTQVHRPAGAEAGFRLWPNPATAEIEFSSEENTMPATLTVTDVLGRQVLQTHFIANGHITLPAGMRAGVYTAAFSRVGAPVQRIRLVIE